MISEYDALLRIAVAALLGGAIGYERELHAKPAGVRTHMLVAEGAALFMVASALIGQEFGPTSAALGMRVDMSRIAAAIVTGIGFLGAGMILRTRDRVGGLTTAAGIWVTAGVGMLVGAGYYVVPIFGTAVAVFIIVVVRRIETRIQGGSHGSPEN